MAMTSRELEERMRALVAEYLGEQAPPAPVEGGCLATALEDAAMAIGDAVTQEILSHQLSGVPEQDHPCPICGSPGLKKGHRQRVLQSRRGEVQFSEPELYCKKCRRSFFPSVGSLGTGS
jgi:hypothetical protein